MPVVISWRSTWACRLIPTPPRRQSVAVGDAQAGPEILKRGGRQPFGHDVSELRGGRHMQDAKLTKSNLLTNKVDVEFDVLGPAVMYRILSKVDG